MNTCWEYGNYDLVWIIGLLDFGMEKKSKNKPIFDEFVFGILVVFGSFRLYLELFWFGFVVDLGLYGN